MKKVLVVDFDVEFLKSVSLMLREEGFEIITAVDGQAGLERFEADKPDLVVLEAMLPRLHGFELCARITENQSHAAPVIVITGVYRDALYKTEALRTFGATAYFEKPVEMSRLMEAVRKALSASTAGAPAPEPKKAPAAGEKPLIRPPAGPQTQTAAAAQAKPLPVIRPQPPPRVQAAPAVAPAAAPQAPPARKKDADQIEIDSLLKSALAELGLEPEEPKAPPKPVVVSPPSVQPPPRPVAPPPPPRPIQPPPRPAAAPIIPPAAKPVQPPLPKPVAPPLQPKPVSPAPTPPQPPVQPAAKPVPPPKPVAPSPPPFQPRIEPAIKPAPQAQPKPVAPPQPKPEPPAPPPPAQRPKPAIVAPPPPIPVPHPAPPPKPAPVPDIQPAPPPLRQPTPEKLPILEKPVEAHVHAPVVPAFEMPEKRPHAPAFQEFMAEPKKKGSPVIFIAAAAVLGVAALGYFLVLKPKSPEATPSIRQVQPPPVVSERVSVENAPRFESQPGEKPAAKTPTGTAKPKPTPPPAIPAEPESTTPANQPVIPVGEPKLEIQVPEQTAPQATAKPATEQTTTAAPGTVLSPPAADVAPAPPAKAQTGQLISLDDLDTPPRMVTRVDPVYPPIAFRMGIQGTVWINALISETGNVLQAIFLRGTTAGGLDKAAETAVLKWKYQPAQKDGVNVKVWLPVRVDFVKRG